MGGGGVGARECVRAQKRALRRGNYMLVKTASLQTRLTSDSFV